MNARKDHEDIFIRESMNGPEVLFCTGTQAWVMNCTEADLVTLERAIVRRRWLREDKAKADQAPISSLGSTS